MSIDSELESPIEEEGGAEEAKVSDSFVDFLKELPVLVIVAFGIALLIKTFLFQAFFIPSASMEPTLTDGDRVFVSKLSYKLGAPERGDIVVFISPTEGPEPKQDRGPVGNFINSIREGLGLKSLETDFIKRVIGTEGQTVEVKRGKVLVNGKAFSEPYLKRSGEPMRDYGPVKLGRNEVFVMGDNRSNSSDSRSFGPIKESSIIGRAFILVWPLNRLDWFGS